MAKRHTPTDVARRGFLTAVASASTALPLTAAAQPSSETAPDKRAARKAAGIPTQAQVAAETAPPKSLAASPAQCGADFMVEVMQSLKIDYVASNPGSSFRGLQESVINYANNTAPEFLTCMHEETSVAMAHGYFKASGKPMAVFAHGTVGLQHASMALYNAWCDRVPVITVLGNITDATQRRPGVEWLHTALDPAVIVRDFTKWDDQPGSLQHFAESFVRAYKLTMTPPMEPVVVVADAELQEEPIANRAALSIPKYVASAPPQGDANAVKEAARWLAGASNPVIVVDRCARTHAGMGLLVALAESLNAPVIDQANRMNFPNTHYLSQNARSRKLIEEADVILALEVNDVWGLINEYIDNEERTTFAKTKAGTKIITISASELYLKSNYQDFQRFVSVDLSIAADAEATLPALTEAVKRAMTAQGKSLAAARGDEMRKSHAAARTRALSDATYAWDASPISTARLAAELGEAIKREDWALVSPDTFISGWARRLWAFDKSYQYLGAAGGQGVGYGMSAAVGAGLANRALGRFSVNIQTDGDLMYAPGSIWTAVHHKIPLLSVMHNNRAYHQETMHIQRMANRHNRGIERAHIGTVIDKPFIDYAMLAKSMGMWAEGPITDPKDLGPALRRAIDVVKRGEPALLDVVTQPR
ncbi:MAG: thiamine pyrophosphate-binding protein [Rhodospirillaceae bacterium]|nr:thiamine pyrophosphate-binding protein [Rhodospirillaceae bacterium]